MKRKPKRIVFPSETIAIFNNVKRTLLLRKVPGKKRPTYEVVGMR